VQKMMTTIDDDYRFPDLCSGVESWCHLSNHVEFLLTAMRYDECYTARKRTCIQRYPSNGTRSVNML